MGEWVSGGIVNEWRQSESVSGGRVRAYRQEIRMCR